MTGPKGRLAWKRVHLALLPTNEDRVKAVVDWAGTAMDVSADGPDHRRSGPAVSGGLPS